MLFLNCNRDVEGLIIDRTSVISLINMSRVNKYYHQIIFNEVFIESLMIKLLVKLLNLNQSKHILSMNFKFDISTNLKFMCCMERSHNLIDIVLYIFKLLFCNIYLFI